MSGLDHAHFMGLALQLVDQAEHRTSPNPIVGCVVVRESEVVGRGVTQPYGRSHAEVMALKDAGPAAQGATMYVTLEPCCHHGRTGPCTDAIIAAGVKQVYVGVIDPNPWSVDADLPYLRRRVSSARQEFSVQNASDIMHRSQNTSLISGLG